MEELERVQFVVEHATELMSLYAAKKLAEMEVVTMSKDMDLAKQEVLKKAKLQSVIKVFLVEVEDDIVVADLGAEQVYPRPMTEVDEQIIDVAQFDTMDEDKHKRIEEAYGVLEYISIDVMTARLE